MRFTKFLAMILALSLAACAPSKQPYLATSTELDLANAKSATGTVKTYFWLFSVGDASLAKLVKEAGITKIHHVDLEEDSYFLVVQIKRYTVYGE